MIFPKFEYLAPQSLEEAISLVSQLGPGCRVMAGGTDLLVLMKEKAIKPEYIVDLKGIDSLDALEYIPEKGLKIGALTTLRSIEKSETVKKYYPAVADSAHYVASTQVRSKGTMAGNICNASPSCDTAPILIVLEATVHTEGPAGPSKIDAEKLFKGPKKTILEQGEIVTEITIPEMKPGQGAAYVKHAYRKAMDLAIVGVAASITLENDRCKDAKIALGAVAATPIRALKAEEMLIGKEMTDDVIEAAAIAAMENCCPISDVRASAEYRQDMVRVFTKRAIKKAMESINA